MDILTTYGFLFYSLLHIPLMITQIVFMFIPAATNFTLGTTFVETATLLMMISGALALILVLIPYISQVAIDELFTTQGVMTLIYYHAVILASIGFNTGSSGTFYWYAETLVNGV